MGGKTRKTTLRNCCGRPKKSRSKSKSNPVLKPASRSRSKSASKSRSRTKSTSTNSSSGTLDRYVSAQYKVFIGKTDIPEFYGKTYSKVYSLPRINRGGKITGVFKCVVSFIVNHSNSLTFLLNLTNYSVHGWTHHLVDPIVTELSDNDKYPNVQVTPNVSYMGTWNKFTDVYNKSIEIKIEDLQFDMNKINADEYVINFQEDDKTLLNNILQKFGNYLPIKSKIPKSISYKDYWFISDTIGNKTSGLHMADTYPKYHKNSHIELKIEDINTGETRFEFDMKWFEDQGSARKKIRTKKHKKKHKESHIKNNKYIKKTIKRKK